MLSITSLATKLDVDFPDYSFVSHNEFRWSPKEATIYYDISSDNCPALLHELSHAILSHMAYTKDIGLLALERDAWEYALKKLAPQYSVAISEDTIQNSLDTYRDWLHSRSTCPKCQATGLQMKRDTYRCVACGTIWHVNDARMCALRRHTITKNTL